MEGRRDTEDIRTQESDLLQDIWVLEILQDRGRPAGPA